MKFVYQNKHLLALFLLIFLLWSSFASAYNGRAQSPFQVGLVVQVNGQIITRCVTLSKDNPTGYDVLVASSLDLITSISSMGVTVCSINGVGCAANDCFCQSSSPPYYYWSYWHLQNGAWTYSSLGASNYIVAAQSVEGWIWGDGKTPPPVIDFASICSPTPSYTPSKTLSSTLNPTKTIQASSTPSPTIKPTTTFVSTPTFTGTAKSNLIRSKTPTLTLTNVNINSSSTPLPITTNPPPLATTPTPFVGSTPSSPTPSATITLAYAIQAQASSTAHPPDTTPIPLSPTSGINFEAISLTATAVEWTRHVTPTPSLAINSLSGLLKTGFVAFLGMLLGLLILLIGVLLRTRK